MLVSSPIVQSERARTLFLVSAFVTAAVLLWAQYFFPRDGLTLIFAELFVDQDSTAASWTLGILVLAVVIPGVASGHRLLQWIGEHVLWVATGIAVLLSLGTLFVYRNHPLAMDEYAPYLQSQIFSAGRLTGHFPIPSMDWLVPPGFQNYFISVSKTTGAVASGYWPSFALLLTPFTALGIPWACNPTISALTLIVAHRLALKIYGDRDIAAWVVLLTAASPEFLINGISYYSMPAHLLANAVFVLLLIEPTPKRAWLAGLVGSIALTLHNPMPHALFALPWIIWIARRSSGLKLTLWLAAGYLPLCLLIGVGWLWFTLHMRQLGMPPQPGAGILDNAYQTLSVFTIPDSSIWLARLVGLAKTWVWSVPGLILLAIVGARANWSHPALRLLTWSAALTLVGYIIVPVDQGHGWGYRYFHSAWIALPLLAAGALIRSKATASARTIFDDEGSRALVIRFAVLMLVVGSAVRAAQVRSFMDFDLAQTPEYRGTERHVELINLNFSFYGADLVQNDPWLRGNVIRMMSHGREKDANMMAQNFPDLHLVYDDIHGAVWSTAPKQPQKKKSGPADPPDALRPRSP